MRNVEIRRITNLMDQKSNEEHGADIIFFIENIQKRIRRREISQEGRTRISPASLART